MEEYIDWQAGIPSASFWAPQEQYIISFISEHFFNNFTEHFVQHLQSLGHCDKHFTFNPRNSKRET